jgi:hypothetical protein
VEVGQELALGALAHQRSQRVQARQEEDSVVRQGLERIEGQPFVLEADGTAAPGQFPGSLPILKGREHGAGGEPYGGVGCLGGLHVQLKAEVRGGFGQHQGQLAAADDADAVQGLGWG